MAWYYYLNLIFFVYLLDIRVYLSVRISKNTCPAIENIDWTHVRLVDRLHLNLLSPLRHVPRVASSPKHRSAMRFLLRLWGLMGPNATQQRILILMTAVLTFFGGFLLARGNEPGVMAALAMLVAGWLLVVVLKPGPSADRRAGRNAV
jgi:hypothetical protein